MSPKQKKQAHLELNEVINEVKNGKLYGFRMKIKGIHAEAFGGQAGGRKTQMDKKGFTIIKIKGNSIKKDIIESSVASKSNEHPAVFPIYIIEEFINLLSPLNGIVLDPYAGSGTTLLAAKNKNRNYVGMEINPDYCDGIIQSLK